MDWISGIFTILVGFGWDLMKNLTTKCGAEVLDSRGMAKWVEATFPSEVRDDGKIKGPKNTRTHFTNATSVCVNSIYMKEERKEKRVRSNCWRKTSRLNF
jgi:hypothetical protein